MLTINLKIETQANVNAIANVELPNMNLAMIMATTMMVCTGIGWSKKEVKNAATRAMIDKLNGKISYEESDRTKKKPNVLNLKYCL